jgi:multimeric flavodoxin WrbA
VTRLLVVHHTASPALHTLLEAVREGASDPQLADVELVTRAALAATALDVMDADGYVLGTPANLGYMSGALKHFFDSIYYPCLEETAGRPFGVYVHGNDDVTGAVAQVEKIVTGLRWKQVHDHVLVLGAPDAAARDAAWDLGATVAARLEG